MPSTQKSPAETTLKPGESERITAAYKKWRDKIRYYADARHAGGEDDSYANGMEGNIRAAELNNKSWSYREAFKAGWRAGNDA